MGKHKESNVQIEDYHPGCMWRILHILDYHHWHVLKKMVPYKRQNHRGDGRETVDDHSEKLLVKARATRSKTRCRRTRIKELMEEEMSTEKDDLLASNNPHGNIRTDLRSSKVNKESFLERFPMQQISEQKAVLNKSRSFPVGSIRPAKPKHKQNEIWPFTKLINESAPRASKHEQRSFQATNQVGDMNQANDFGEKRSHRRSLSLNESAARCNQLLHSGFKRETNWRLSKSLKLSNEDFNLSGYHASKHMDAIFSLPNVLKPEVCGEHKIEVSDDNEKHTKTREFCLDNHDPSFHQERETALKNEEIEQASPVSVLETCFQPSTTTKGPEFSFSEGLGFENCQVDIEKKADFEFVREVLEKSGFNGNEFLGKWHSLDQPLNPSVLEETEICEISDPRLLFDLVDEALLEIYDRSCTYFPRAISSNCRVRPIPRGTHLLNEVWAIISRYSSSGSPFEQTLDHIIAGDLARDDGWINLQCETECVALDLEDLIFEELLDELLCS